MGEGRSICLISSMKNTGQESYLTEVLRRLQDHFRIRRDDEKAMIQREKRSKLTPSLIWGLGGAPGAVHFSQPRKLGSQKG